MNKLLSRAIDIAEHDDIYEFMFDHGLTDGLPVVPPTRPRVERMLAATSRAPAEILGHLPPNDIPATIEKIAVNAVMSGAKPEYFPLILAAAEAALSPQYPLHGALASTDGIAPLMVVNGPVRAQIGMNWGLNALGQGNRANSTIGRALRLVFWNLAGARPGEIDQTVQGGAHKWTLTYAEYEEASPWQPFHVEHGWDLDQSVVTLVPTVGGPRICVDETSRTARALSGSLALAFQRIFAPNGQIGPTMLVLSPEHADVFRRDGWSKDNLREAIYERTLLPLRDRLANPELGGGVMPHALTRGALKHLPLDTPTAKVSDSSHILLTVAGSHAGKRTGIYTGIVPRMQPDNLNPFVPASARVES